MFLIFHHFCCRHRALYNYKPQNDDEVELAEGDVVYVMEKCDDGWFVGTSQRTGIFGTFPGNYVSKAWTKTKTLIIFHDSNKWWKIHQEEKKILKKNREIVFEMTKNSSSFQNRILNSLKILSLKKIVVCFYVKTALQYALFAHILHNDLKKPSLI